MAYVHDADATLDYQWNWSAWLPQGDSIDSHQITVDAPLEVVSHTRVGAVVTAWLRLASPAPVGRTLKATCRVTTGNLPARVDERTIELVVGAR